MSRGNRSIPAPPVIQTGGNEEEIPEPLVPAAVVKHDPIKSLMSRKGPIEVIALANGFIAPRRVAKGDRFTIDGPEKLGSWMKCVDPTIQKEHAIYCKEHKKRMQQLEKRSAGD